MLSLVLLAMLAKVPVPLPETINPGEKYGCNASGIKQEPGVMPGVLVYVWVGIKPFVFGAPLTEQPRWHRLLSTRAFDSSTETDRARRLALKDCDEWLRAIEKKQRTEQKADK